MTISAVPLRWDAAAVLAAWKTVPGALHKRCTYSTHPVRLLSLERALSRHGSASSSKSAPLLLHNSSYAPTSEHWKKMTISAPPAARTLRVSIQEQREKGGQGVLECSSHR